MQNAATKYVYVFAEGNRHGVFPSFSAGWRISEEPFMEGARVSFLKLRAGYGEVGNTAIDPFQTLGGLNRTLIYSVPQLLLDLKTI
jgi:hypothetical protein